MFKHSSRNSNLAGNPQISDWTHMKLRQKIEYVSITGRMCCSNDYVHCTVYSTTHFNSILHSYQFLNTHSINWQIPINSSTLSDLDTQTFSVQVPAETQTHSNESNQ